MESVTEPASITTSPPPLTPSAQLVPLGSAPPATSPAPPIIRTTAAAAAQQATSTFTCSEEIGQILAALARAQLKFGRFERKHTAKVTPKDSSRAGYSYDYGALDDLIGAVRSALNNEGIALLQPAQTRQNSVMVTTFFGHESGQWFRNDFTLPTSTGDPQIVAGAVTYAKRIALQALSGIAPEPEEDDDGQAASDSVAVARREPPPVQTVPMPQRQPAAVCSECNGTGKLTRLGGDWGQAPNTEVPCWKCQPSNKPAAKKLTIERLQKKESGNGSPYWAVELSDKQQALTFDTKKGDALEDARVRGDVVTKFITRKQGSYTHIDMLEIEGVRI